MEETVEVPFTNPLTQIVPDALAGPVSVEETFCISAIVGGATALLSIAAYLTFKHKKNQSKPSELRDVDLPLNGNELNHYSLYVE